MTDADFPITKSETIFHIIYIIIVALLFILMIGIMVFKLSNKVKENDIEGEKMKLKKMVEVEIEGEKMKLKKMVEVEIDICDEDKRQCGNYCLYNDGHDFCDLFQDGVAEERCKQCIDVYGKGYIWL
jgi:uncharacterized protein YpmS